MPALKHLNNSSFFSKLEKHNHDDKATVLKLWLGPAQSSCCISYYINFLPLQNNFSLSLLTSNLLHLSSLWLALSAGKSAFRIHWENGIILPGTSSFSYHQVYQLYLLQHQCREPSLQVLWMKSPCLTETNPLQRAKSMRKHEFESRSLEFLNSGSQPFYFLKHLVFFSLSLLHYVHQAQISSNTSYIKNKTKNPRLPLIISSFFCSL